MNRGTRLAASAGIALLLVGVAAWPLQPSSPEFNASRSSREDDAPLSAVSGRPGEAPGALFESKRLNPEEFVVEARRVLEALPSQRKLHEETTEENAHYGPEALSDAGEELGRIARILHDQPELGDAGIQFYGECARKEDLPRSIRALCYSDLRELTLKAGLGMDEDVTDYPEEVQALAGKLTPWVGVE